MIKPIVFIEALRKSDKYIEDIYTQGGCWQFHKVLKLLYPSATPYKAMSDMYCNQHDHIVSKIENDFYDITGNVNDKYFSVCSVEEDDVPVFEKWTFGDRFYFGRECPYCSEIITPIDIG